MKPRKVYLSFLGANNLYGTNYTSNNLTVPETTRFIQKATLRSLKGHFSPTDRAYIFTTEKARLKNWEDSGGDSGLRSELEELNLESKVENIMVPAGNSQSQLWEIFQIVYDQIEEGDILHFDTTSGFRSLPLLVLPLINYANFLKGTSVGGIYYGAFEPGKSETPIWNLTDLNKLQQWTNAANIFLKTGNAKGIIEQIEGEAYSDVKAGLERFSEFTLVNRGMDIYSGKEIIELNKSLNTISESEKPADKAARPIFEKVRDTFKPYKEDTAVNGFHAARWCIENGLIQQAATILEEFIISYLMELVGENNMANRVVRSIVLNKVKYADDYIPTGLESFSEEREENICDNIDQLSEFEDIRPLVKKLSNKVRNDVNHAGFRRKAKDYEFIKRTTIEVFNDLVDQLNKRDYQISKYSE